MSQQQVARITLSALNLWSESGTRESYSAWIAAQKRMGFLWGADETLDEAPNAE